MSLHQLTTGGLSPDEVRHAVSVGHLQRVGRGVYAWGARPPLPRTRCWSALLAYGPGSALSHRTAAVLWSLVKHLGSVLHVTSPTRRRDRHGIRAHEAPLRDEDVVTREDGLRVTTLPRTLLDLAATEHEAVLLVAVRQALTLHRTLTASIFALLADAGGHRGRGPLRRALSAVARDPGSGESRGSFEDAFWLALLPHADRLPEYTRNQLIRNGDEAYQGDLVFPGPRVVIELDVRDHHDNDPSFDADRRRDRRLAAWGWVVIRITPRHLREDPDAVIEDLLAALGARA